MYKSTLLVLLSAASLFGDIIYRSDGTTTQKVGNTYFHSDGTTTTVIK